MHLKYKSGSSWIDYNLVIYPVGAYYFSNSSTSPATLFGGTWANLTGRFLYCNNGTGTGGHNSYTLTYDNLPRHSHNLYIYRTSREVNGAGLPATGSFGNRGIIESGTVTHPTYQESRTDYQGGSVSFSTMPQYKTCYCWYRTA